MTDREDQRSTLESYYRAACFGNDRVALLAYTQAQDLLAQIPCELSAYRYSLNRVWHTVVLGEAPPADLDDRIEVILATGEPTTVPEELLQELQRRRLAAIKLGPWVERHYRGGYTEEPR